MDRHDIFISYRRDGGEHLAARVKDALKARGFSVFMDIEDLKSGKFNEALLQKIGAATDFLVILTPGCLERCQDGEDWLRKEIRHAIACKRNIVPILARGFQMPHPQALPADISELPNYNGLAPAHELFEASIDRLVSNFLKSSHTLPTAPTVSVTAPPERSFIPEARDAHNRGVEHHRRGDFDLAIAEYTEAIKLDPSIAWAFIDRGVARLRSGELDNALRDLNTGIQLDSRHAWPYHDRATIFLRTNRLQEAIADYTEALRINPEMAWSYHDRGAARVALGQFSEAIADFTEAIQRDPNLESAYRHRADAYRALGQTERAAADLRLAEEVTHRRPT